MHNILIICIDSYFIRNSFEKYSWSITQTWGQALSKGLKSNPKALSEGLKAFNSRGFENHLQTKIFLQVIPLLTMMLKLKMKMTNYRQGY